MTRLLVFTLAAAASPAVTETGERLSTDLWKGLRGDGRALLWLALLQVALILLAWILSRVMEPRREMNSFGQYEGRPGGGFWPALLLYILYAAIAVTAVVGLRLASLDFKLSLLTVLTKPATVGMRNLAIILGLGFGAVIIGLLLPMAIFRIRLGRTVAFLLLLLVLLAGAGWGLDVVLKRPVERRVAAVQAWAAEHSGKGGLLTSLVAQTKEEVAFSAAEKSAADPAKPLAERKEAVRNLYAQLEAIREQLKDGDVAGRLDYDRKKARYDAALKQIRAEIAAAPEATKGAE